MTERKIEDSRQGYLPITIHASGMFFTIASLATLDHMYYFSLPWFINLFISSIDNTEKFEEIDLRLACLKEHFTQSLHESVCHGLFQKDKVTILTV